jgi:hypothetical protein
MRRNVLGVPSEMSKTGHYMSAVGVSADGLGLIRLIGGQVFAAPISDRGTV